MKIPNHNFFCCADFQATMDDVNAFFSMSSDFKRETISSGSVCGRVIPKLEPNKFAKREFHGTNYGDEYRQAELEEMKKVTVVFHFFVVVLNRFSYKITIYCCLVMLSLRFIILILSVQLR